MMGGLAYMTGPEGRPLRAGSSVNDIMGGMFGAIGVLAALRSAAQHRPRPGGAERAVREQRAAGGAAHDAVRRHRPGRRADAQPHLGLGHLRRVHRPGRRADLPRGGDRHAVGAVLRGLRPRRAEGRRTPGQPTTQRVRARDWLLPRLREQLGAVWTPPRSARASKPSGLPYAPITRPQDLFDDPHLRATGGLAPVTLPADASSAGQRIDTHTPLLPLTLAGQRLPLRTPPPALGEHSLELLRVAGLRRRRHRRAVRRRRGRHAGADGAHFLMTCSRALSRSLRASSVSL